MKQKIIILLSMLLVTYLLLPIHLSAASPAATLTVDETLIGSYPSVQEAVDAVTQTAGSRFVVEIAGVTLSDPLNITQQTGKDLSLYPQTGASVTVTNTITIDGNGNFYGAEGVLLQGLTFDMTASDSPANCIYFNLIPPRTGYCYPHNITINNCQFNGIEDVTVAVQSVAGGSRNIAITNCTADGMHSLAQLKAVAGYALIQNCIVTNSSAGVNFYGPANLLVDSSQFTVTGYAVRSGQGSGVISDNGSVTINNSILESSSTEDGVIVLRGDSTKNINILHSILTASATDGMVLQNLNAASSALYRITFSETDIGGLITGIDDAAITIIDDPNVPNGPVNIGPQPDIEWMIILLVVFAVLLVIFAFAIVVLIILYKRLRCRCYCCCSDCAESQS